MSNINWGQFVNSFVNNFSKVSTNNLQNNIQNNTQQQTNSQEIYIARPVLPNTTQQLAQTTAELAVLNQAQSVNMVKELMNFPKNFEQLLTQLTNNQMQSQDVTNSLLLLLSSADLSKLPAMLQNNSKEAMSNLYNMMAKFNQMGLSLKDEQIGQISKMLTFIAASSTNDVQTLKTVMLMYLPWLPLTDSEAFKLELNNKANDMGFIGEDSVTVLIATENYGNIHAVIYKTDEDGIKIEATTSETFPQNDIVSLMKNEGKKYNININFELAKKTVFNKDKAEKTKTQVFMNTSPGVNPFLLLMSNAFIKNVHKIDNKDSLIAARKEKINNVKS